MQLLCLQLHKALNASSNDSRDQMCHCGPLQRVLCPAAYVSGEALTPAGNTARTLMTFARNIRPGFACWSMVRLGLPARLVGMLVGVCCPLGVLLEYLNRDGSDSLLVKGGRGMLWLLRRVATSRNLAAVVEAKVCLLMEVWDSKVAPRVAKHEESTMHARHECLSGGTRVRRVMCRSSS